MDNKLDFMTIELEKAISESLENLIFAEIESRDELTTINQVGSAFIVSISTKDPVHYFIHLIFEEEFAQEIVLELLGDEIETMNTAFVQDALSEIGNTVAGRFLSKVVPRDKEFELGFPLCRPFENERDSFQKDEFTSIFVLDMEGRKINCVLQNIEKN